MKQKKRNQRRTVFQKDNAYQPDAFALWLLEFAYPTWLPDRLRSQMKDALRGFSKDMALEVASKLVDCLAYGVRQYTGIDHVDRHLHSLYNKITYAATKQGIELPMHF